MPDPRNGDDPLRQAQARRYGRARRRLGAADSAVSLVALIAVVAAAGSLGGWGSLAALVVVLPLVSLPFGYVGYRLSRANGLSRQTVGGWAVDRAKGWAVGVVIGLPAGLMLLWLQQELPDTWPLPAWLGALILSALLALAFPVLLLPIFLRSEPMPDGELATALRATIAATGIHVRELRLLHLGDKTTAANAMVAGIGPTLKVYVGDTLSDGADGAERIAETRLVLAHELGHHVHRDTVRLLGWAAVSLAFGVTGAWIAVAALAPDGGGHLTALPAIALGLTIGSGIVSPAGAWYSRRRERAADDYAVGMTGEGERYAVALERLAAQNLSELEPPHLYHALTSSHPMPCERISAARATRQAVQDYTQGERTSPR